MTKEECIQKAVEQLNSIAHYDSKIAHIEADDVLFGLLDNIGLEAVTRAYEYCKNRYGGWTLE